MPRSKTIIRMHDSSTPNGLPPGELGQFINKIRGPTGTVSEINNQDQVVPEALPSDSTSGPDRSVPSQATDENGYEWLTTEDGSNYYRVIDSMDEWIKFEN